MPELIEPRERPLIERYLRRDPALHLYELGDLDPFFWPHTRWFASRDPGGELSALALLYTGAEQPVLLALGREHDETLASLVRALAPRLPARLYAHLSPGLAAQLGPDWTAEHHGRYLKLALARPERLAEVDTGAVERLTPAELEPILDFYRAAYPNNWFDPRMLATKQYFGVRERGRLVCIAGVHVYSRAYRAAALGNIATNPAQRGRGLARRVVAGLCRSLLDEGVELIGLNVETDNHPALACYRRLGFTEVAPYDEYTLTRVR